MAEPGAAGNEPNKKSRMTYLLILVGTLIAILAAYYFLAFTKQGKAHPGNTEAKPGALFLLSVTGSDALRKAR